MEGQITIAEFQGWKQDIKDRLNQTVENFIVIGYRLRQIEESEAYRMDGYSSLNEFAKAEFNLSSSTVSRFKSINVKFTVGGNGMELLPEYKGMEYSKLQEMLNLSEEDRGLITSNTTVNVIKDLKKFNKSDSNAQPAPQEGRTPLQECIWGFFEIVGNKELLEEVIEQIGRPDYSEQVAERIADTIAPAGNRSHRQGIVFLFMYEYSRGIAYKLMTSPMPVKMNWMQFLEEVRSTYASYMGCEGSVWEAAYGQVEKETKEIPGQMVLSVEQDVNAGNETVTNCHALKETTAAVVEEKEHFATSQDEKDAELPVGSSLENIKPVVNITEEAEIVEKTPLEVPVDVVNTTCGADLEENGEAPAETEGCADELEHTEGTQAEDIAGPAVGVEECAEIAQDVVETVDKIWDRLETNVAILNIYIRNNKGSLEYIEESNLQTIYRKAVDVAADMERLINVKKHHTA